MTTADHAATTPWAGIQAKPEFFPPSAHRHATIDLDRGAAVAGDVLTWDGKKWVAQPPNKRKLLSETNGALARFEEELTLVTDGQQALARKATTLEAKFGESEARFTDQITALATKTKASVTRETELVARLDDAEAKIRRTDEVIVTRDSALARTTEEITAKIANNKASIVTIKSSYATRDFAEAKKTEAITAATSYTDSSITTEASARATADSAEATLRLTLDAQVNDPATGLPAAHAAIISEASTRATADSAEATARLTLDAQVNDPTTGLPNAHARVTSEVTARASADSAEATARLALDAQVNDATTGLPNAHARITSEATTRASQDTALSSSISTVSATVNTKARTFPPGGSPPTATAVGDLWVDTSNGNQLKRWDGGAWTNTDVASGAIGTVSASVSTEATARASADGQIHARWGVNVDINGRITGKVNLDGTNAGTTFTILADAIRFYNGTSDISPFSVSGGVVKMTSVVVTSELDIGSGDNRTHITGTSVSFGNGTVFGSGAGSNYTLIFGSLASSGISIQANSSGSLALMRFYATGIQKASVTDSGIANFSSVVVTGAGNLTVGGDIYLGTGGTVRWLYDANGDRILNSRYSGTPVTLSDVIAVLQHHGLSN